jgi:hypothetical protein
VSGTFCHLCLGPLIKALSSISGILENPWQIDCRFAGPP